MRNTGVNEKKKSIKNSQPGFTFEIYTDFVSGLYYDAFM
jgi:hypothetical protein